MPSRLQAGSQRQPRKRRLLRPPQSSQQHTRLAQVTASQLMPRAKHSHRSKRPLQLPSLANPSQHSRRLLLLPLAKPSQRSKRPLQQQQQQQQQLPANPSQHSQLRKVQQQPPLSQRRPHLPLPARQRKQHLLLATRKRQRQRQAARICSCRRRPQRLVRRCAIGLLQ